MGVVASAYDTHGWHEFEAGWQGPDWCSICDCLVDEHVTHEYYLAHQERYREAAERYQKLRDAEDGYEVWRP
jgi:hypothetical protein